MSRAVALQFTIRHMLTAQLRITREVAGYMRLKTALVRILTLQRSKGIEVSPPVVFGTYLPAVDKYMGEDSVSVR